MESLSLRDARIVGDQVKCWNCPYTLGQIVNGIEEPRVLGVRPDVYRSVPVPEALAASGIRSVLVILSRARDQLARTGLPWRRRRGLDKQGQPPFNRRCSSRCPRSCRASGRAVAKPTKSSCLPPNKGA